jgi:hypothetical protein
LINNNTNNKPQASYTMSIDERRIIHGIPFFVQRGASKTEPTSVYAWAPGAPMLFGTYDPKSDKLDITVTAEATKRRDEWRATQTPRPRAQLRVGR